MKRYDPKAIEPKWQKLWADTKLYAAKDFDPRPKYVMLTEFPYPSGDGLHLGHVREYTLGDIVARRRRMEGFNVLYPMGYDSFGLPTENYAIRNKIPPQQATEQNIANFQRQFDSLGYSIDWDRSFSTTDPDYYRWTQWLFLQFFKAGLAYQAEIAINWCPKCKTGLANEEVVNGRHERCGTPVEKRQIKQWLFKITAYADRLLEGLKDVDYPSRIADQQINWIGKSIGAEVVFPVDGHKHKIEVFTTRIDTLYGATYMVLAPEHPLVDKITTADQRARVDTYVKAAQTESEIDRMETEREKTGVFTGAHAINPATEEKIPIWVADYVLMGYGTGAIMAVPAHDDRDYQFAKTHDLPIRNVVDPDVIRADVEGMTEFKHKHKVVALTEDSHGRLLTIHWKPGLGGRLFIGGTKEQGESTEQTALRELKEETGYMDAEVLEVGDETFHYKYFAHAKNQASSAEVKYVHLKLQSSRQVEPALEEAEKANFQVEWIDREMARDEITDPLHRYAFDKFIEGKVFSDEGIIANSGEFDGLSSAEAREKMTKKFGKEKVNYKLRDWIFSRQHYWGEPIPIIHCPDHGAVAVPDDQLPVELPPVENYEPTDTGESPLAAIKDWVETTCPKCGKPARRETDTMPNWAGSSWYYLRYLDSKNPKEFADQKKLKYWLPVDMYLGGMEHTTLHLLYSRFWHQFLYDQKLVPTPEPYAARRGQGIVLAADGSKMSKTRGNIVDPTQFIDEGYGADAVRLAVAFLAPYDQTTPWNPNGIDGTKRFLNRVWNLVQEHLEAKTGDQPSATDQALETAVASTVHKALKKVTLDLEGFGFNTAIAAMMEAVNELYKLKTELSLSSPAWRDNLKVLVQMLAPFAPHLAEELWQQLGSEESVHVSPWPVFDPELVKEELLTIVLQVNGKVRGQIEVVAGTPEDEVKKAAQENENILRYTEGKTVAKTIVVPGKLVNFVVK